MSDYVETLERPRKQITGIQALNKRNVGENHEIRQLMIEWGNWGHERYGTEYPCVSAGMAASIPQTSTPRKCTDVTAMQVDAAMCQMKKDDREMFEILFGYYYERKLQKELAEYVAQYRKRTERYYGRVSVMTISRHLRQAEKKIAEILNISLDNC